jgi:hypothetical protein
MTASIIAPIAMAIPPNDMILELMPWRYITVNEIRIAMGKMMIATSALRKCSKNAMQTSATTMLSSTSFRSSVATARSINAVRSYATV